MLRGIRAVLRRTFCRGQGSRSRLAKKAVMPSLASGARCGYSEVVVGGYVRAGGRRPRAGLSLLAGVFSYFPIRKKVFAPRRFRFHEFFFAMKVLQLDAKSQAELAQINKAISKSKKVVVLTGAGISCSAGIPDFRSAHGLYNQAKRSDKQQSIVRGKDLFDISLFRNDESITLFCKFMQQLYTKTCTARPTKTHWFIRRLKKHGKLLKCYTQNIDGLERHCDLRTGVDTNWKELDVVQLHGDLNRLSCTMCSSRFAWDDENSDTLREGELPDCPNCMAKYRERAELGKRASRSAVGVLRPDIVLYGEHHPHADSLARGLTSDMAKNPNLLIIFGTSLKVDGVRKLVRQLSRRIHERQDGKVIFINDCEVSPSAWDKVIDYQIKSDCDEWCEYIEKQIPALFEEPEETSVYFTPPSTPAKKRVVDVQNILTEPMSSKPITALRNVTNTSITDTSGLRAGEKRGYELPSPEFSPVKRRRA
ncbi:hypothetical protein KL939_004705 [Ogataea angusta]|nr:hypothetical protein KL939_004705 [Ogataea angusta]